MAIEAKTARSEALRNVGRLAPFHPTRTPLACRRPDWLHAGPIYEHEGSGQEDPHNLAVRPRCVNGYLSKYKMLYVVTSYRPMIQSGDTSYLDAAPVAAQLLRPT
jgi:hypothetical protein